LRDEKTCAKVCRLRSRLVALEPLPVATELQNLLGRGKNADLLAGL
jgi:hypothetical protein